MKDVIALCREDAASDVDRDEIRREADASLRDTVSALTKHLLGDDLKLEFKPISEYSEEVALMNRKRFVCLALVGVLAFAGLAGCGKEEESPDFSGYSKIAELATIKCVYHNVAEIYNDGTNMLFGINVGYKKAWFEYDGTMQLGVDVSKVRIEGPDENNVVTIVIPQAQVLGVPDADESTFFRCLQRHGPADLDHLRRSAEAYAAAQDKMRESAEGNEMLIREARDRAEMLLFQYVEGVGKKLGVEYEIRVKDAE